MFAVDSLNAILKQDSAADVSGFGEEIVLFADGRWIFPVNKAFLCTYSCTNQQHSLYIIINIIQKGVKLFHYNGVFILIYEELHLAPKIVF